MTSHLLAARCLFLRCEHVYSGVFFLVLLGRAMSARMQCVSREAAAEVMWIGKRNTPFPPSTSSGERA
jgi:hypothetical protein